MKDYTRDEGWKENVLYGDRRLKAQLCYGFYLAACPKSLMDAFTAH